MSSAEWFKVRKKPLVVRARRLDEETKVHTPEGRLQASAGDYLVSGIEGEVYPVDADIFRETYDVVGDQTVDVGDVASEEKAYQERNLLALGFASMQYPSAGFYFEDTSPDWPVVWCKVPAGQLSWHLHPDLTELLGGSILQQREPPSGYDGHTVAEKNSRLREHIESRGDS